AQRPLTGFFFLPPQSGALRPLRVEEPAPAKAGVPKSDGGAPKARRLRCQRLSSPQPSPANRERERARLDAFPFPRFAGEGAEGGWGRAEGAETPRHRLPSPQPSPVNGRGGRRTSLLFPSPFTGRACPREGGGAEGGWGRAEGAEASTPPPALTPTLSRERERGRERLARRIAGRFFFSLPPQSGGRACPPRRRGCRRRMGARRRRGNSPPPPALTPTLSRKREREPRPKQAPAGPDRSITYHPTPLSQ